MGCIVYILIRLGKFILKLRNKFNVSLNKNLNYGPKGISITMQTTKIKIIDGLQAINPKYDAFIIDLWGVIHDGFIAYPGTVDRINHLISINKPIIFMSNAPRPNKIVLQKLLDLRINATSDMVLTSGDATRLFLKEELIKMPSKKYYHLGAHRNSDLLADIDLHLVDDISQADSILLTAYIDENEDLEQFDHILKQAAMLQLHVICPNPDKIVINGNKNRYCAGFLAEKYEQLGGKVHYYGKPHVAIYNIALEYLQSLGIYNKDRILMIGDTLETDIQGAANVGIKSTLVLTGNTGNLLKNHQYTQIFQEQALENLFHEYNLFPDHILKSLN